jgi:hypothetical protein
MEVRENAVNPLGVETAGPPLDSMDLVSFRQQEFRQIRSILTCDSSN